MTFPETVDDALKQTIYDWFQFRPVCDDDRFNVYFNRVLNRDIGRYNELLRIQPGISNYDWLVTKYQETQWTHEGQNDITRSSELNGTVTGNIRMNGTGHIGMDETVKSTEGQSGRDTLTRDDTKRTTYAGTETTRHDTSDGSGTNLGNEYKKNFTKNGSIKNSESYGPNSKITETINKKGSEKSTHLSGANDGETHTITKNGTRTVTKLSGTGNGEQDTVSRNGSKTTAFTATNKDQNSGGVTTTHGETIGTSTTETPGVTETVTTKNNQTQIADNKNLQKTLPMSSGSGDFSATKEGNVLTGSPAGTNMPGFTWHDASAMSESTQATHFEGSGDTQTTGRVGSNTSSENVTHGGQDSTQDTTAVDHTKNENTTETWNGYSETHNKVINRNESESEKYEGLGQTENIKYARNYSDENTFNGREDTKVTSYDTTKDNEETYRNYTEGTNETKIEHYADAKSFNDRTDTVNDNGTESTEYGKQVTTNGTTGRTQDSTTQQTTDNSETNQQKTSGTEAGTDASLDRLIHTGRDASAPELLTAAAQFIKGSSAWAWLEWRLEPCFLGIYDV